MYLYPVSDGRDGGNPVIKDGKEFVMLQQKLHVRTAPLVKSPRRIEFVSSHDYTGEGFLYELYPGNRDLSHVLVSSGDIRSGTGSPW